MAKAATSEGCEAKPEDAIVFLQAVIADAASLPDEEFGVAPPVARAGLQLQLSLMQSSAGRPVEALQAAGAGLAMAVALQSTPTQRKAEDGGNDNWYEVVQGSIFAPFSFETARAAALGSTHLGLSGYLATITSAGEEQFVLNNSSFSFFFGGDAIIFTGATDTVTEGRWVWADGPEAGNEVSYPNWIPGHPLGGPGFEGFHYVQLNIAGSTRGWRTNTNSASNYIIEYGDGIPDTAGSAVPEPSTVLLSGLGLLATVVWRRRRMTGCAEGRV